MFKLLIKKQNEELYWKESFDSLEELNLWLDEEKARSYWDNNNIIEILDLRPESQPNYNDVLIENAWAELRAKRNALLSECDFTQLSDCNLSDEDKIRYKVYRQALRDLPTNTIDPLNPIYPIL